MNLTDLANARSGFSQEMNNLLTLIAGSHTAEQRSAQITTTTAECFTLCKTAKAVRVANPNSINTEEFYARPDLPLCELMDGFHTNLGGTRMYEMFCRKPVIRNPECTNPPFKPDFPTGPLVLMFPSGTDVHTCLFGFQGTIEIVGGGTTTYSEPTHLARMDLPDDGNGYCTLLLRGHLEHRSQHDLAPVTDYRLTPDHIVDVWQWGTECTIGTFQEFFVYADLPCFGIHAEDGPTFPQGDNVEDMFHVATYFNSDINHWDVSPITNMSHMFATAINFNQPLDQWDVSNVTSFWNMFHSCSAFNQDLSAWDVSNGTNFEGMFKGAASYTGDILSWNMSAAVRVAYMFQDAELMQTDHSTYDLSHVASFSRTWFAPHLPQWMMPIGVINDGS